ncbi:integrase [Aureimonas endophytica]|uniref:Integrase n=1 Tax=Aureimonas endophytica TaxID=2027858 RepID=A0A917E2J8_9HYPH|nr:integrase arm-type DNA-binding domain-containing protein [Aureimonas endophytica]GGD93676.1 integrase [Aureimonas endophytica]
MARGLNKLSDTAIKSANLKAGRHSDGGGLYLNVAPAGSKSWLFMWVRDGKRREMGMGAYPSISLAKARKLAAECREHVGAGRDPIAERKAQRLAATEPTFGECANMVISAKTTSWRNEKHAAQWKMTLEIYAKPLRGIRVSEIGTDEVLKVVSPLWSSKPETASRLRGRIETVLNFAKARGWRTGENPALWRGHLENILPARPRLSRGHHAALPYQRLPALMKEIRAAAALGAAPLEFAILTAARSGEVHGALWSEIDLKDEVWTIPARRMKMGKEHRVPLSKRAIAILKAAAELRQNEFVFPGRVEGKSISKMAMDGLLDTLKADCTVHGFRSTFRDWCGNETDYPREVAEQALAHSVGNEVERAYRRGDALEKRRQLMEAWSAYLAPAEAPTVTRLRA